MNEMLWAGRFEAPLHPEALGLTTSIEVDMRLLEHDVAATKAHARALAEAGLLESDEVPRIDNALDELVEQRRGDSKAPPGEVEDVHSFVEKVLIDRLGETGARIHAGRSRNDLVATDLRLWCRDAAAQTLGLAVDLLNVIAARGEEQAEAVMPGYTHLQRAQPVSLGFHLLAHGFALARDGRRFAAALNSANSSTMGAGAVAGTTLPLDPARVAAQLHFPEIFDNAMDAVSDRDFACDLVYAAALCGVHLSRLAEEIVLWTTAEFGFARLPDEWSTGSSMMPQKRNPDLAELVRGRAAGGIADATGLLCLLKGLPLAYNRDLQEDKGFLFPAADRVASSLVAMTQLLEAIRFDRERLAEAAKAGSAWATDLAECLVQRGVPFRNAHAAVGSLVATLEARGGDLASASSADLQQHHGDFRGDDARLADPRAGLYARGGVGGTHPDRVREQAEQLRTVARELARVPAEAAGS